MEVNNNIIRIENSSTPQFCDIIGTMKPEDIENMPTGREMDALIEAALRILNAIPPTLAILPPGAHHNPGVEISEPILYPDTQENEK
jgi:hypothetical protein